jgi:hypothetical protein
VDRWLAQAHVALTADLAGFLDLDAGLALIVSARPAVTRRAPHGPADEDAPAPTGRDPQLRPIAGLLALPAEARLRLRGSRAFDALTGVFVTLAAVTESHDDADPVELAAQVTRVLGRVLDLTRHQVLAHEPTSGTAADFAVALDLTTALEVTITDAHVLGAALDWDTVRGRADDLAFAIMRIRPRSDLGYRFDSDMLLARVLSRGLASLLALWPIATIPVA